MMLVLYLMKQEYDKEPTIKAKRHNNKIVPAK